MTLHDLLKIKESLEECVPDYENIAWGPTIELARQRKELALQILEREIELYFIKKD